SKMSGSERDAHYYESESGGSYSSPLHSPPRRVSESDGGHSSPSGERSVPIQKVRQIVATQGDVLPFTPDGIYALAKVSELFVEHLLNDTIDLHGMDEEIGYDQLAETIQNDEDLSFLHDFFPPRISFEEAQERADAKIHEEDES
ncbi:hypothetical protein PMAYCL1PPCAC_01692, partial [Pristionchus mayeri]